jgi:hypothetical protein
MDYQFRYRLQSAPQARHDGSGCVDHDIFAEASSDGENWATVPGRHKTISVPAGELHAALSAGTNPQIIAAYKGALAANLNTQPAPVSGWTLAQLEALMDANDTAGAVAFDANEFITETLHLSYPVVFVI